MADKPRRQYELELTIGADSIDDLAAALRNIEFELVAEYLSDGGISVGYNSSWTYRFTHNEGCDHETWQAELDAYLAEQHDRKESEVA